MTQVSTAPPDSVAGTAAPERTFDKAIARVRLWTLLPVVALPFSIVVALCDEAEQHSSWYSALPAGFADLVEYVVLYGLALVWWLVVTSTERHSLGRLIGHAPTRSDWKLVGLATISQGCIGLGWVLLSLQLWGAPFGWGMPEETPPPAGPFEALSRGFAVVFLAPFVEELLFRGVLFRKWRQSWGPVAGALGSSLAFGVVHFDILGASLAGLTMLLVYTRTRSLWAAIAVHAIHNACAFALQYYEWLAPEHAERFFTRLTSAPNEAGWGHTGWWALLALSLVWLLAFLRRSWPTLSAPLPPTAPASSPSS